ncbi:MAG: winged helix-turn-helix domain-containing protein [Candidatus Shapirobacteria bacterium]|jgi:DNA-binding winged helix-turn-helix (wHTH) protein
MRDINSKVLSVINRGENATLIFVPNAGRNWVMSRLDFGEPGKYKVIRIEKERLISEDSVDFYRLMAEELGIVGAGDDLGSIFNKIEAEIKRLLSGGIQIIIILVDFESLHYPLSVWNNMVYLWRKNKVLIHYIFGVNRDIFDGESLTKLGKVAELVGQNKIYYPLYSKEESNGVIADFVRRYGYKIKKEKGEAIWKITGGHPYLIKVFLRGLSLKSCWEVKKVFNDILESVGGKDKRLMGLLAAGGKVEDKYFSDFVRQNGLVKKGKLFLRMFEEYIKNKKLIDKMRLEFDEKRGEIVAGGVVVSDIFSLNEYQLLRGFLESRGRVISREEVARVLWGKRADVKYSDWAIDKMVGSLRKKMAEESIGNRIQTVRGRGYRLIN